MDNGKQDLWLFFGGLSVSLTELRAMYEDLRLAWRLGYENR